MVRTRKSTPCFFKDTSKKDLVTRAGRLGGRRYNRFSLQVESVYSDYPRVAIIGNDVNDDNKTPPALCVGLYVVNKSYAFQGTGWGI
jgi:hypothetical protein